MKAGNAKGKNSRDRTSTKQELPVLAFATKGAWEAWIVTHHASSDGVWLKIAKNGSNSRSITYAEALDVALAWGWIDGQKGKFDDAWWLQRFTRRGPRSVWSQINRKNAESMIAAGKMKQPGLAEIERAKRDGRWEAAYESQSKASVPPDLAAALKLNSRAARFFETLDSRNRYAVLFRIHTAKKRETRALRIERFVTMLSRHEKLHS
jgi:uncharacterized protein YdeI (YjbR/CyaY-like superfamily)